MSSFTINSVMEENILKSYWRPVCAVVYLIICLFDFLVMPIIYANTIDHDPIFQQINSMESDKAQVALINKLDFSKQAWEPITLGGAGTFHLAFGALLTGAAVTRGLEKRAYRTGRRPNDHQTLI